ncbi:MAG: VOC family protein [Betaproteobacteria bacterium]|nr:MAG: VOC family protein [Betaproteobacteria bacterium]
MTMQKITPFLWFDSQAEDAAKFYVSVFRDAAIGTIARRSAETGAHTGKAAGSVLTVAFTLNGQQFVALNGGPHFEINEAVSFVVNCESQEEVDYYWDKLSADGPVAAQQCGWLKDRYGLSWQIVPTVLPELMGGGDAAKSQRVMQALLQMKKIDIASLRKAAD